jgi:hypothetical protein
VDAAALGGVSLTETAQPADSSRLQPAGAASNGARSARAVPHSPVAPSPATSGHGATGAGQQRPPPPRPEQASSLQPLTFRLVNEVNQINSFLIPYVMASLGPNMHDAGQAHAQVKAIFQTVVEALNIGNCRGRWSELVHMFQTEIDGRMKYIKKNFQTVEQVPRFKFVPVI